MSRTSSSTVTAEMLAIYAEHHTITRQLVVERASPPDAPLHDYFEWDDEVAGPEYRLIQAGHLIRSCRIRYRTSQGTEAEVRQFVSVRAPNTPSDYRLTTDVDPITQRLILDQMRRELRSFRARYGHLREFWESLDAMTDEQLEQGSA
jgi:hypothetical protein